MDKTLVQLAVDTYKGHLRGNYSKDDSNEILYKALVEANGGSTTLDYKSIRDGKCNGLFSIVETILTKTVVEGLPESNPLFDYVELQNLKDGDRGVFEIKDNGAFVVSDIAFGTQGLRRQRLAGGQEITVKTQLKGIKVYEELRRILAKRVDFTDFIDKVSEAFQRKFRDDAFEAVVNAFAGLEAPYTNGVAGTFAEDKLQEIIDHVEAATGKKAKILCAKQAARKITGVRGGDSDSAKEDLYSVGYYGHFYTTPIIAMDNAHKVGSTDFVLGNDLYVIAGDSKFIKAVVEGETTIIPGNPNANADLSQEFTTMMNYGIKAVITEEMGVYRLS